MNLNDSSCTTLDGQHCTSVKTHDVRPTDASTDPLDFRTPEPEIARPPSIKRIACYNFAVKCDCAAVADRLNDFERLATVFYICFGSHPSETFTKICFRHLRRVGCMDSYLETFHIAPDSKASSQDTEQKLPVLDTCQIHVSWAVTLPPRTQPGQTEQEDNIQKYIAAVTISECCKQPVKMKFWISLPVSGS